MLWTKALCRRGLLEDQEYWLLPWCTWYSRWWPGCRLICGSSRIRLLVSATVIQQLGRRSPLQVFPCWLTYPACVVLLSFGCRESFYRRFLRSNIAADVSHYGTVSLDLNPVRTVIDLEYLLRVDLCTLYGLWRVAARRTILARQSAISPLKARCCSSG